ncbi:mCG1030980, partial [Mus musculus]
GQSLESSAMARVAKKVHWSRAATAVAATAKAKRSKLKKTAAKRSKLKKTAAKRFKLNKKRNPRSKLPKRSHHSLIHSFIRSRSCGCCHCCCHCCCLHSRPSYRKSTFKVRYPKLSSFTPFFGHSFP